LGSRLPNLCPQLTMGLAWFLVYWKWRVLRTGDEEYNKAVRFGPRYSVSISLSAWLLESQWNFSSVRTGQAFLGMPAG
jgi:hypothetical protein